MTSLHSLLFLFVLVSLINLAAPYDLKTPNRKSQIPNKSKTPRLKIQNSFFLGHWSFDYLLLFGYWCLEFGISPWDLVLVV
jgi:hypothetical protein